MSKLEGNRKKTGGRKKGTPNKHTALLKDAILAAGANAGKGEGLEGYLTSQAVLNPNAFLSLLGKVLPLQIAGDKDNPVGVLFQTVYEQRSKD